MLTIVDSAGREVAFPTRLLAATPYLFQVRFNGFATVKSEWALMQEAEELSKGSGNPDFTAPLAASLSLHVRSLLSTGFWSEAVFSFSAVSRRSTEVELGIAWGRSFYSDQDTLRATVLVMDPEGLPARSITWHLFKNSALVNSGTGALVTHADAGYGVYRLQALVTDGVGGSHEVSSTTYVQGGFEVQSAVVPVQPTGTLYHLGDVYLTRVTADAGVSTELPVVTASLSMSTFLLPGTTHYRFDLLGQADDEVVVRTAMGNWAVIGPPTGLSTERLGYDYALPSLYFPAPSDLCLQVAVDLWNVHDYAYSSSSFNVRVRCLRSGPLLSTYAPCPCSEYPGGDGLRTRKLALLFSEASLELDVEHGSNRFGSLAVERFVTDLPTSFPATLASSGEPFDVEPARSLSLSPANLVTVYEPVQGSLGEVDSRGVSGRSGVRPFIMTFTQPGNPLLVQRLKRLGGRVACYLSAGAVEVGASVAVGIETSLRGLVEFQIPIAQTVYAPEGTFVKVGEIALELVDYEFSPGGFTAHMALTDNEVSARTDSTRAGNFRLVAANPSTSLPGRYRLVRAQVSTGLQGSFRLAAGHTFGVAGRFSIWNGQTDRGISGSFKVVANTSTSLPGRYRLVRQMQKSNLRGRFKLVAA